MYQRQVLQYTFDGNKQLADQNGKNELKLSGGASGTDDGNKGKGLLLDGTDGYAELPDNILSSDMTITTWVKINKFTTWGRVFDFGTDSNQNFFFAPYSGGAVSYTHLDVYKRQLIKSKSGIKDISELTNTANSVSYTHLDC